MKSIAGIVSALAVLFTAMGTPFSAFAGDEYRFTGLCYKRKPQEKKADSVAVYPKGWVGLYPFAAIGGSLMLGYQHRFSPKFGLHINGAVGFSENSNYYGVQKLTLFYFEAQGRYFAYNYSEKNGFFGGLYAAPFLQYKRMAFEYGMFEFGTFENRKSSAAAFGGGALIGFQLGWKALVMDLYLGVGVQNATGDYTAINNVVIDKYRKSVFFHPGFSVGVKLY